MGELIYDIFDELDVATRDYNKKLQLDKEGFFDDRFVVGVYEEDESGMRTKIERFNKMRYRAAIIGCGRIGCGFKDDHRRKNLVYGHAQSYDAVADTTLVGVSDTDGLKLETSAKKFNVPGYTNYEDMLREEEPHVVSICTPPHTHCDIIQACLKYGVRAIYCEKPIDSSAEKAEEAIAACAEKNVLLAVNHQRRFGKFHQLFARAVQSGVIGEIQQISVNYVAGISNTGTHFIDLLQFYLGKDVERVRGWKSANECPNSSDLNIDGWMFFEGGPVASIQSTNSFGILEIILTTTLGRFTINMHHPFTTDPVLACERVVENKFFEGATKLEKTTNFPGLEWAHDQDHNDMRCAVEQIVDCLNREEYNIVSDGTSGLSSLRVIDSLTQSIQENSMVFVKGEKCQN